jgi:hypothetical protein
LGAVPTILTLQATGGASTEAGCIAWNGTANVTGSCTTGLGTFTGGQEKPGASQTQTQVVTNAMDLNGFSGTISSYGNLGLVMNLAEPAGGPITLTNLVLTVYSGSSAPKSVSLTCPAGGCAFNSSTPGLGKSDVLFGISSDEVASLGTFSSTARVGVAASFTNAQGAPESFFLAAIPTPGTSGVGGTGGGPTGGVGGDAAPEPASALLLLPAAAALLFKLRR